MSANTQIVVVGNLTEDPSDSTTGQGIRVSNVSIASTKRLFDRESGEWKDGAPMYYRGSVWRNTAANVVKSLHKGDRVIAIGEIEDASYEKDGVKHKAINLVISEIAASLEFATAELTRKGGSGKSKAEPKDEDDDFNPKSEKKDKKKDKKKKDKEKPAAAAADSDDDFS